MTMNEILSGPEKWCKNTLARDAKGLPCPVFCGESFCLVGASMLTNDPQATRNAIHKSIRKHHYKYNDLSAFNDNPNTTFEDIKKVIKDL